MSLVYLDHAATTPLRPEARAAMEPWLGDHYGNPSGVHGAARRARRAVDDARDQVAEVLGCESSEVVFTSGGTEADNLAVFGVHRNREGSVVCSAIEHHAVLHPVEALGGNTVPVDAQGRVDLDALAAAVGDDTTLVSVMLVNNEVGTIQDLTAVAEVVKRQNPTALLHTDAVQAVSWLDVATAAGPADLISVSAHKFGGPQGVGALVARHGVDVAPLLLGGGQEHERRSGTHNVAGIAGMGAAAVATATGRADQVAKLGALRDRLLDGLDAAIPDLVATGEVRNARPPVVAGLCHVCIPGVESEALLFLLEQDGLCASAASSCASGAQEPSHVLAAMGIDRSLAAGSLRLSLNWASTDEDVESALRLIPPAVERLRAFGS